MHTIGEGGLGVQIGEKECEMRVEGGVGVKEGEEKEK